MTGWAGRSRCRPIRHVAAIALVCGMAATAWAENLQVAKDAEHFLDHGGRSRRYTVHVPPQYDRQKPTPVVINLHGGGGRERSARRQALLDEVADRHGFLVVYPEGTGQLRRRFLTWNSGRCCGYAVDKKVDDVDFFRALLDDLPRHYAVDPRRIYATGMSNGAMMCYRLACELPGRIAAIAPVSGALSLDLPPPRHAMPVIHFHGLQDQNVPFAGGMGANARLKIKHRSVADTIAVFQPVNHFAPTPQVEQRPDVVIERYLPPADAPPGSAPFVLYKVIEGGHTWPGGDDITARFGTGKLVASVDASGLMWEFFQKHPLPDAVGAK